MSCFGFSLTEFHAKRVHKSFEAKGLESRLIELSNGSTIHCWVPKGFSPQTGNGEEKPALVLIHGFGSAAMWQWSEQVKPLLQSFNLFLPDMLFFGLSTTTNEQRTESFQAECMWETLSSLGVKKFSVCGTSYGGFVAYRLAQKHPEAVEKVIISNSSTLMTHEDDLALCERGGGAENIPDLLLPTTRKGLEIVGSLVFAKPPSSWFIPNFLVKDHLRVLFLPNRKEKVELLEQMEFGHEAGARLISKIDKEVLIVWGESDKLFPLEQAERVKDYLGDRAELVVIKNAGHVSQMEQPAEWNLLVMKFLLGRDPTATVDSAT